MIGQMISRYKISAKLGEGGMGVVYKAEDTELEREVALKFLPRQIAANTEERQRFKVEAKAAAALNHSNIATIYNIEEVKPGTLEGGNELFIVMEYIEGQNLVGVIHESPLPIDRAIDYAIQIAEGLEAAHEKGITHRDIKPANIMITPKARVKIMDFGLAKIAGSALTQVGMTLGTVSYMSPEQTHGAKLDHRTDIWSLGVVLYEMLAGECPFQGHYEQAVIYSIMNEDPESLRGRRPDVSQALEAVINKALAKDPEERFQSAAEMASQLNSLKAIAAVAGSPISAEPATGVASGTAGMTRDNLRRQLAKRHVLATLFALAVVATLVVLYFAQIRNRASGTTVETESPVQPVTLPRGSFPKAHSSVILELRQIQKTAAFMQRINELKQAMRIRVGNRADFDPPDGCYVFVMNQESVEAGFFYAQGVFYDLSSAERLLELGAKHAGKTSVWLKEVGN